MAKSETSKNSAVAKKSALPNTNKKAAPRDRSKNIDEAQTELIIAIIDAWQGDKFTWDLLLLAIAERLKVTYTRQTLFAHSKISRAYAIRKELLSGKARKVLDRAVSPELRAALAKVEKLEAENARLKQEVDNFTELFAKWAYDARLKGVSIKC